MQISIGADHAGFPLKATVITAVERLGHSVIDCGSDGTESVDFPDVTQATCAPVLRGEAQRAILICGTGAGTIMAANKIPGDPLRPGNEPYSSHQAVEHDDANVIALGAWLVPAAFVDDDPTDAAVGEDQQEVADGNPGQPHGSERSPLKAVTQVSKQPETHPSTVLTIPPGGALIVPLTYQVIRRGATSYWRWRPASV